MTAHKLSEQQYSLVEVLWALGEGSAKDIQQHQPDLDLAHTTIGTILTRLEKKGVLSSKMRGREKVFVPLISEAQVKRSMVSNLVSTLFGGNKAALMAHLVEDNQFEKDDLAEIKKLLDEDAKS